jgi:hypothetical protein
MIDSTHRAFKQERNLERARRLVLSQLACLGRHTMTGVICTSGQQFRDWTADYRLFSRERFEKDAVFGELRKEAADNLPAAGPVVCVMDDSVMRKKGKKIPGTGQVRDPLSLHFRPNLIWAQRFIQVSMMVPSGEEEAPARGVPIDFICAPLTRKPRRTSSPESWEQYLLLKEQNNISRLGAERIKKLRSELASDELTAGRPLWVAVDGRFTNTRVFKEAPEGTVLIGRLRADSRLYYLPCPEDNPRGAGRKRSYGRRAPTPDELRKDESVSWQSVPIFAAGKVHNFRVKVLSGVLWKPAGPDKPLLLVVIGPLYYRPSKKSNVLYRDPAYLVCTDPGAPLREIIQAFVWRWEIEVNIRDEKQLVGLGQAQMRNEKSVGSDPALVVAAYSMLLLAGMKAFPNQDCSLPPPRWRKKHKPRLSTQDLINELRFELWGKAMGVDYAAAHNMVRTKGNFEGFRCATLVDQKPEKYTPELMSAVLYATG